MVPQQEGRRQGVVELAQLVELVELKSFGKVNYSVGLVKHMDSLIYLHLDSE